MKHESVSESARRVFPWEKAGMSQTEWIYQYGNHI